MQFKVLTYNIHKGFCFYTRKYVLRELREAIREVDADLVFLQEIMGVHPLAQRESIELESQFEFLADELWPHHAYGKNAVYTSGHHGNAVLSKSPLLFERNVDISNHRFERRGLLHSTIARESRAAGPQLHLVNLHLDLTDRGRKTQMQRLIHHIKNEIPTNEPVIVAGDFNDWFQRFTQPLSRELNLEEAGVSCYGRHVSTFPAPWPVLALDRVYVRGLKIKSHQVLREGIWSRMSDHAAVLVGLSWE